MYLIIACPKVFIYKLSYLSLTRVSLRTSFLRNWPKMHLPTQVVVCTACFGMALPVSIALFPQTIEVRGQSAH